MSNQRYEPQWPWIWYGDGMWAQAVFRKEGITDDDGLPIIEIRVRPTKELMVRFGIYDEDLDVNYQTIIKRYPKEKVLDLSGDPNSGNILVLCDFEGRDTRLTNYFAEMLVGLEGKEKMITALRAENAYLHETIRKMTSQLELFDKENVDRLQRILKLRGQQNEEGGYDEVEHAGGGGGQSG